MGLTILKKLTNPNQPESVSAMTPAMIKFRRDSAMVLKAALPASSASCSLCWIHSLEAVLRRAPTSAKEPWRRATASSRCPLVASDMIFSAASIHSSFKARKSDNILWSRASEMSSSP